MCGICGIINIDFSPISPQLLIAMRDSLTHRGPDDCGCVLLKINDTSERKNFIKYKEWKTEQGIDRSGYSVGLAHRRLSIIDLSIAGNQPMADMTGSFWITFNGEIYNFQEIRKTLIEKGYSFNSGTDTEVIINAYKEWGERCLEHFNGMFAFALYDSHKQRLFLARDRVGKKPLYYCKTPDAFYFSSELKAILSVIKSIPNPDFDSLNYYFSLGYIPHEMTLYSGIKKLPAAHACFFDCINGKMNIWRYWELPEPGGDQQKISEEDLIEEFHELIFNAVKIRMISDVPVGVFLSGGLDSSLVTSIAAQCSSEPLKTFTVSFPGYKQYDETGYAKIIADHFSTDHYCLDGTEALDYVIKDVLGFLDEPIADSSILPMYVISKLTRKHVTVALGGDGGDELFGGYNHYQMAIRLQKRLRFIPSILLELAAKGSGFLPPGMRGKNFIQSLKRGPSEIQIWGTPYFEANLRRKMFSKDLLGKLEQSIEAPEKMKLELLKKTEIIDRMMRLDFQSFLCDDILTKIDRASMACSLEVRNPWLDYRLVEFSFKKVPSFLKATENEKKVLPKKLARLLLPLQLDLNRKQGFSVPLDSWMKNNLPFVDSSINGSIVNELIKPSVLKSLFAGELKGRLNGARLFLLLMLSKVPFNRGNQLLNNCESDI